MSRVGRPLLHLLFPILLAAATLAAVAAQDRRADAPPVPTAADYARAETFLAPNLSSLVVGGSVAPNWLPDERLWYRNITAAGTEFILVDPVTRTREPAFDHVRLAASLSAAAGTTYQPRELPFQTIVYSADGSNVLFDLDNRRWSCGVDGKKCEPTGQAAAVPGAPPTGFGGGTRGSGGRGAGGAGPTSSDGKPLATSPDGKRAVFIRDWNLWVRDLTTAAERALTTDGVKYFGYATDNAGWSSSDRAILLWSPDSKKVATFQQDERDVGEMYLVTTPVNPVGHPTLRVSKFPLPGDKAVAMLHRVVIDVDTGRVTRLQMPRTTTARRSATTSACATCSGARTRRAWRSSRPRAITSGRCSGWPTWPTAPCAPWWTRP